MDYRLTGISTPIGGLSWSKVTSEKTLFQYLLLYLETKRILTNPIDMEVKSECISSVLEIKNTLPECAKVTSISKTGLAFIREMINACNKYLNTVKDESIPHLIYKANGETWGNYSFDHAMKEFRYSFRDTIKKIEKQYRLSFAALIPDEY